MKSRNVIMTMLRNNDKAQHFSDLTKKELMWKCNNMNARIVRMCDTIMKLRLEIDYLKRGGDNQIIRDKNETIFMLQKKNQRLEREKMGMESHIRELKEEKNELTRKLIMDSIENKPKDEEISEEQKRKNEEEAYSEVQEEMLLEEKQKEFEQELRNVLRTITEECQAINRNK